MDQTETSEKIGKYRLIRHIATGGMAEIWLAEQEGPGDFFKELVIKRILPHLAQDDNFTQMFLDEARLVAQLSHPNIGQIYDLGEVDGSFFIAMEYIDGLDMASLFELAPQRQVALPIPMVAHILASVLRALDYAHNYVDRQGNPVNLVHRDVTPHNVLISKDGIVKLVDFGVAKASENQNKTQTGAVKGKYAYMAPEQVKNGPLDHRVDIFAVGIVLYEALTGIKPFGEDLYAIAAILGEDPADPRIHRPDVPDEIIRILTRALCKEPDGRYHSADEMAREFDIYLRQAPVSERDIASLVRELKGLPMTTGRLELPSLDEISGAYPKRETAREHALPPLNTTQVQVQDEGSAPKFPDTADMPAVPQPTTGGHGAVPEPSLPQLPHQPTSPQPQLPQPIPTPRPTTSTAALVTDTRNNKVLILGFFGVMGAIVLAGAVIFGLIIKDNKPDPGTTTTTTTTTTKTTTATAKKTTKTTTPPPKQGHNPKALFHPDGMPVFITSNVPSQVFFRNKLLGPSPIQTRLKSGTYEVEFRAGKARKKGILKVITGQPVNSLRVSFAK